MDIQGAQKYFTYLFIEYLGTLWKYTVQHTWFKVTAPNLVTMQRFTDKKSAYVSERFKKTISYNNSLNFSCTLLTSGNSMKNCLLEIEKGTTTIKNSTCAYF